MDARTYASPRALRAALDAAQLDQHVPPAHWGGHLTLRSWLLDGATRQSATAVWPLVATPVHGPRHP
jgi:hypothetical protein